VVLPGGAGRAERRRREAAFQRPAAGRRRVAARFLRSDEKIFVGGHRRWHGGHYGRCGRYGLCGRACL